MERVYRGEARVRETGAVSCALLAVLPALAAPASPLAWFGVLAALLATVATIALVATGRAPRARTTVALTFLALVAAQVASSPMVLTDPGGLLLRGVLLVGLPLPLLTGAFVLATGAADARRRAWGQRYQERIGHEAPRAQPTMDWG